MRRVLSVLAIVLLFAGGPLLAQAGTGRITGTVTSADGARPLAGAVVTIRGRSAGALTGADGRYTIQGVQPGSYQVTASLIGHAAQTQQVSVSAGGAAVADFVLAPSAIAVEGIVAVGYGQQQSRDVTGVVETVSTEMFNEGRVVSPEQLIAAKVAGVQVVDSGEPGGGINLRIRGGTSVTSSNEPLFVVNGVPLPVGGGLSAGRNPLNFLNPDDIASITVLKDASATAIYGSRGANGVVLIETKSGLSAPQLSYSGSVSASQVGEGPSLLSADQFRALVAERAPDKLGMLGSASTDWRGELERSAVGQEHNLAFAGAGEDLNYRLSLGILDQPGVIRGSATERVSAALNYGQRLFDDALEVEATLLGARTEDQFSPGGILGAATAFDPTQPVRTGNGFFEWTEFPLAPNNPVAELALTEDEGTTYRGLGSLQARYAFSWLQGLAATARGSFDVASSERRIFRPSTLQSQLETSPSGLVSRSTPVQTNAVLDAFVNYATAMSAWNSALDATLGYSYETNAERSPFFEVRGLSSDLLRTSGVPTAEEQLSRINERENRLASFFGRMNLSLQDRYLLTLSVRRDGSSRFGPANQWGTFPSAAVAWRIGQEEFLAGSPWLSDLKLRASWGKNGNQSFGDYLWVSAYRFGDAFARVQFGDEFVNTIRPSAVDPNIKWEETTSYNLGLDYGILDNRLSGSVEFYSKDTDDLIFTVPVAAGTNLSNFVTTNIGSVRNRGVELSLNALMLDGGRDGFRWEAGFNAAANRNELLRINSVGDGTEQILTGGIAGGVGSNIQVLQPGFPVNSFFVYRHIRDASGRPVYADTNGDGNINEADLYEDLNGDGVINQSDRAPYEDPSADWSFGHTSQLGYGNFDLGFTLRAQLGNHVYNNLASNLGNYRELAATGAPVNLHTSVLETGFATPQYFSDVYVEDASFLRMDNLTLGFTLPGGVRGADQVRVFGTVQNVFTLTDYSGVDPLAGLNGIDNNLYPRSRTFSAGVSVGF